MSLLCCTCYAIPEKTAFSETLHQKLDTHSCIPCNARGSAQAPNTSRSPKENTFYTLFSRFAGSSTARDGRRKQFIFPHPTTFLAQVIPEEMFCLPSIKNLFGVVMVQKCICVNKSIPLALTLAILLTV